MSSDLAATDASASSPKAEPFDPLAEADAQAARARELFDVPGLAVAVVVGDEVVLAKGYGLRTLGQPEPVGPKTSFAIASNTKAFTATALGMLVAEGKLDWDDRVVDHVPDLQLWDRWVTSELRIRDLLSHRVGLATWAGDMMWISSSFDRDTVLKRLRHLPTAYGFRSHYGYCNLMFMVAGVVIEKASGQRWDDYVRAKILDPLEMKQVATRVGQLEGREDVATPHIQVGGEWKTTEYLDLAAIGPAASFHANVEDMAKWVRMQLADGRVGERELVPAGVIRETRQPHMWLTLGASDFYEPRRHLAGYGLGWYVADYRGQSMVWHGGGMPGMTSRVLLFPDSDIGVVVLTSSESGVSGALALQIAELFLAPEGPRTDYLARMHELSAGVEEAPAPKLEGEAPDLLRGSWQNPMLGRARIVEAEDHWWFEAYEHGGLRCRLYAGADPRQPASVPCAWEDPNMGVSDMQLEWKGGKLRSLRFKVRPDFYDPLEYRFER